MGFSNIIQEIKFKTKHGNPDTTNAYAQLDKSIRPESVMHQSNRVGYLLANSACYICMGCRDSSVTFLIFKDLMF